VLRRAAELDAPRPPYDAALAQRLAPEELAIVRRLADFPDFIADAAAGREPHRLTSYIEELAREFQSYYTRLQKVHGDTILPPQRQQVGDWRAAWDWQKTAARLHWIEAIRQVIATALGILGVSAPDRLERPPEEPDGDGNG
jgi:arginyl-tRNA synthetase